MATLEYLLRALVEKAKEIAPSSTQPLSDAQYSAGFDNLLRGLGQTTYQDFITPELLPTSASPELRGTHLGARNRSRSAQRLL
jgi:hypothetical protein